MSVAIPAAVIAAACAAQARWRVPAAVTIAQWALESGWGARCPGNNPFGIKAVPPQPFTEVPTHEDIHGRYIAIEARFRSFPDLAAAFDAHGELLATHPAYHDAMQKCGDPNAFADALTGVYATDPDYGAKLRAIMAGRGLYAIGPCAKPTEPAQPTADDLNAEEITRIAAKG